MPAGTPINDLHTRVGVDIDPLKRGLQRAGIVTEQGGRKMGRSFDRTRKSALGVGTAVKALVPLLVAVGATRALRGIANVNARFQDLQVTLNTVFGSMREGQAAMDFIQDFAQRTPFDIETLTRSMIQLQGAGITPTERLLTNLGDAAASTTNRLQSFETLIRITTRAAGGGLGLEELEQLVTAGIPVYQILQDEIGKSRLELSELGKTAEGAAEIMEGLNRGLESRFAGGMIRASQNLSVATSNMGIAASNLAQAFGDTDSPDGFTESVTTLATAMTRLFDQLNPLAGAFGGVLAKGVDRFAAGIERLADLVEKWNNKNLFERALGIDPDEEENTRQSSRRLPPVIPHPYNSAHNAHKTPLDDEARAHLKFGVDLLSFAALGAPFVGPAVRATRASRLTKLNRADRKDRLDELRGEGMGSYLTRGPKVRRHFDDKLIDELKFLGYDTVIGPGGAARRSLSGGRFIGGAVRTGVGAALGAATYFGGHSLIGDGRNHLYGQKSNPQTPYSQLVEPFGGIGYSHGDYSHKTRMDALGGKGRDISGAFVKDYANRQTARDELSQRNQIRDKAEEASEGVEALKEALEGLREELAQSLSNDVSSAFFDDMTESLKKGSLEMENLENVAQNLVATLAKQAIQLAIINPLLNSIGLGGGAAGALLPTFGLFGKRGGGNVNKGMPVVVGEEGPEVYFPHSTGRIMSKRGGMASAPPVVVNQTLNIATGVQETVSAEISDRLPDIAAASAQAIIDNGRDGQLGAILQGA